MSHERIEARNGRLAMVKRVTVVHALPYQLDRVS